MFYRCIVVFVQKKQPKFSGNFSRNFQNFRKIVSDVFRSPSWNNKHNLSLITMLVKYSVHIIGKTSLLIYNHLQRNKYITNMY